MESRPANTVPANTVATRLLVLSDTHGQGYSIPKSISGTTPIDVVVHCGDFTQHAKISEIKTALQLLEDIDARLKLIIAGNHDFSLDIPVFREKVAEAKRLADGVDDALVQAGYGACGEARELFDRAKERAIHLLDEGTHLFTLANGAQLKVYASPYTPCPPGEEPTWGFQYREGHTFDIEEGTDLVITHGPPHGVFDSADKRRLGCPDLFGSVARAKPKVHCFGHVHSSWGAKMAAWRDKISQNPSHFSDIDHGKSTTIHTLASLERKEGQEMEGFCRARYSNADPDCGEGTKTLFVNSAMQGEHGLDQLPWIVDIDLPCAKPLFEDGGDARHYGSLEDRTEDTAAAGMKRSVSTIMEPEAENPRKKARSISNPENPIASRFILPPNNRREQQPVQNSDSSPSLDHEFQISIA